MVPPLLEPLDISGKTITTDALLTQRKLAHYALDWNWDGDRSAIRTGHGPENLTALRRFAIGVIKSKTKESVSSTIQRLARNVRLVFDYLRMTENSRTHR